MWKYIKIEGLEAKLAQIIFFTTWENHTKDKYFRKKKKKNQVLPCYLFSFST